MGITSVIINAVMEELGITEEMVDKIKSVIDNVDVQQYNGKTVIQIKTKNITIVIDK
tara:strand:- start:16 stop:186 length:171 start_codon:yes stop_codon:yes gene_type:complete